MVHFSGTNVVWHEGKPNTRGVVPLPPLAQGLDKL